MFTVGLRSKAFDPATLKRIATETGGSYAEAGSTAQLAPIYAALGARLAGEYLLQYKSQVAPKSHVDVSVVGRRLRRRRRRPTPHRRRPGCRRSTARSCRASCSRRCRCSCSRSSRRQSWAWHCTRRSTAAVRTSSIGSAPSCRVSPLRCGVAPWPRRAAAAARAAGTRRARGWLASLERELEIANIDMTATRAASYALLATTAAFVLLALISPGARAARLPDPLHRAGDGQAEAEAGPRRVLGPAADEPPGPGVCAPFGTQLQRRTRDGRRPRRRTVEA